MDVILRDHVENLGNRGEIVKVADGYARNYLLPRKLALPATDANRRWVERERVRFEAKEASEKAEAEGAAARLAEVALLFARRVGEHDTLYGSVTAADIVEALAERQIEIDKRRILLADPLKQLGEFAVPVRIHREVTAQIKVVVVKQEDAT